MGSRSTLFRLSLAVVEDAGSGGLTLGLIAAVVFLPGSGAKIGSLFGGFLLVLAWWLTLQPSNARAWQSDVARTAWAEIDGDAVTLHEVRNCDYRTETDYTPRCETRTLHLSQLIGVDVATIYWGSPWIAHGSQWGFLEGGATDTQPLSGGFTLNTPYFLSVAVADVFGGSSDQLTATLSGGATATQSCAIPPRPGGASGGALPFVTCTLAFTPTTNAPVIITFANGTAATLALDHVQLAVPEPSTWTLLGVCAVGVAVAALRWRATSKKFR